MPCEAQKRHQYTHEQRCLTELYFLSFFLFIVPCHSCPCECYLGKSVSSLCWRPDGKALALGLEDGTVSLHDVEVSFIAELEKLHISVCIRSSL